MASPAQSRALTSAVSNDGRAIAIGTNNGEVTVDAARYRVPPLPSPSSEVIGIAFLDRQTVVGAMMSGRSPPGRSLNRRRR
jgi:hypothetical protein